jgi:hypothetical protein
MEIADISTFSAIVPLAVVRTSTFFTILFLPFFAHDSEINITLLTTNSIKKMLHTKESIFGKTAERLF